MSFTASSRALGRVKLADGLAVGAAPFWKACADGKEDRVAEMLKTEFNQNAKDKDGETGLMKAAAHGHVGVVKKVLDTPNIELWEVDAKGRTALMHAAENGQDAVVRLFITYYNATPYPRSDPFNLADAKGRTALMLAADKGHGGVVQTLLNTSSVFNGAAWNLAFGGGGPPLVDPGRKDDDGKTALDLAEAGKHAGAADLLKKAMMK
jgi:ankyrin repeat protein